MKVIRPIDVEPDPLNLFLLWTGPRPSFGRHAQILGCLRSIRRIVPDRPVYLFSDVLKPDDLDHAHDKAVIVDFSIEELFADSPLEGHWIDVGGNFCFLSNVFRLAALWKWGGTYFDVDDLMISEPPCEMNIIPQCMLSSLALEEWYPAPIIPASEKALAIANYYRFGSDPLVNFKQGNPFLEKWMLGCLVHRQEDSGQVVPTGIFAAEKNNYENWISPTIWSDLLLHPYEGGHFVGDQRYPGSRIDINRRCDASEARSAYHTLKMAYSFFLVKNHGFRCHSPNGPVRTILEWIVSDLFERLFDPEFK